MHDGFIAKPLGPGQIDQAFPLVSAIAPDLRVERWRAFAAAVVGEGPRQGVPTGIMTVQNTNGYILGLFSYSQEEHLRHGRILMVENFFVLDLFDMAGAASTLLKAMDGVARQLGCTAIHTTLPEDFQALPAYCDAILACFRSEGHAVEAVRLCKALDGANDNDARGTAASGRSRPGAAE